WHSYATLLVYLYDYSILFLCAGTAQARQQDILPIWLTLCDPGLPFYLSTGTQRKPISRLYSFHAGVHTRYVGELLPRADPNLVQAVAPPPGTNLPGVDRS